MKSIQTKIIVLSMCVIILCSGIIGGMGIWHSKVVSDQNSAQIMNLFCREEGKKIDQIFSGIEQSVKIIAYNCIQHEEMKEVLESDELREAYIQKLSPMVLAVANSTQGAMAAYVHFNPEIAPSDAGIFYSRSVLAESFKKQQVTDLAKVKTEDRSKMDWYYEPVEIGKAVWLSPYDNGKTSEKIISYVMPVYQEDVLLGIAGMDILFEDLIKEVESVKLYETGYAFLLGEENRVIYHPLNHTEFKVQNEGEWKKYVEYAERDKAGKRIYRLAEDGEQYTVTFCNIKNGMKLVLMVPQAEINAQRNELIADILVFSFIISVFGIMLSAFISQGVIRPLKELTEASKQIATGNFQVNLPAKSKDEVGELSRSFQQTADCLRAYMDRVNELAYTDPLTSVKSKTAYGEEVHKINEGIRMGFHQFGLMMFDINGLKEMNDSHGHDVGDNYIKNSCKLICTIFKHSPVFRIGGDEFVVILRGQDLLKSELLIHKFYDKMEEMKRQAEKPEEQISIAFGMAVFKEHQDREYQDVFKRADDNMYVNKKSMKAGETPVLKIETS